MPIQPLFKVMVSSFIHQGRTACFLRWLAPFCLQVYNSSADKRCCVTRQTMLNIGLRPNKEFFERKSVFPKSRLMPMSEQCRRQWFVVSPNSRDTAVWVLQDPYQPMMFRALPAQGPSYSRFVPPYRHVHGRFPNNAIGDWWVGQELCPSVLQLQAAQHGLSSP